MLITKEHQESWVNAYFKEKHTADECSGFIDGINKALEYVMENLPPTQPNGDEVVDVTINTMNDFLQDNTNNGHPFSISNIRLIFNLLNQEEISFSRFVELLNERASRQPEIDALREALDNEKVNVGMYRTIADGFEEENSALQKQVEELERKFAKAAWVLVDNGIFIDGITYNNH